MKRCLLSLVIKKIQINNKILFTPIQFAKNEKVTSFNMEEEYKELSYTANRINYIK